MQQNYMNNLSLGKQKDREWFINAETKNIFLRELLLLSSMRENVFPFSGELVYFIYWDLRILHTKI